MVDTDKISRARMTMQILLSAQEELEDLPVEVEAGDIIRQIDKMILEVAAQMAVAYEPTCKGCDKDVEAMEEWAKTVDVFLKAATKLANQKKF